MLGYVMCAEQAAGFGRAGRWEPLVHGLAVCSRRNTRGYLEPFCGGSQSPPCTRKAGGGHPGPPSLPAGPWPPTDVPWALKVGLEWRVSWVGADTSRSGTAPSPTFSRSCGQRSAPLAPNCAASLDRGHLPAVDWSWCPPRREIASIMPQISGFPLGWSGSWEERGGRPRREFEVAARPARLGRGSGGRFQCFLPTRGPLRASLAFFSFAGLWGIPYLRWCQLRWRWADFPTSGPPVAERRESHPTPALLPKER